MTAISDDAVQGQTDELIVKLAQPSFSELFFKLWPYVLVAVYFLIAILVWLGWAGRNWAAEVGPAYAPMSFEHWLGTNALGQDQAARLSQAIAQLWSTVAPAACLSVLVGTLVGVMMALQQGRWLGQFCRYLADLCDSLPSYLLLVCLAIALKSVRGNSLVMTVLFWPAIARAIDVQLRRFWRRAYMDAARVSGVGVMRLLAVHAWPLVRPVIFALAITALANCMKAQLVLGFIGLDGGVAPSLGLLLQSGIQAALAYQYQTLVWPFAVSFLFLLACDTLAVRQFHRAYPSI
jgi:peptide/nickel transport system permease protein